MVSSGLLTWNHFSHFFPASAKMTYDFCSLFKCYSKLRLYIHIPLTLSPWGENLLAMVFELPNVFFNVQTVKFSLQLFYLFFLHFSLAWKWADVFFVILSWGHTYRYMDIKYNLVLFSIFLMIKDTLHFKRNFMLSIFISLWGHSIFCFLIWNNVLHPSAC